MPRLAARLWVDAYIAYLRQANIPVYVSAHGDDTAGVVMVKLCTLDGKATLYQKSYVIDADTPQWVVAVQGDEVEVDGYIARQQNMDPDLWILEVEDRLGRHFLDELAV